MDEAALRDEVARLRAQLAELQGTARSLDVLNQFARTLLLDTDIDQVLWDVCNQVVARLGFEDCVIYVVDPARGVLVQRAAFGPKNPRDREILAPLELPLGRGIVGAVAASGAVERIADTRLDPRYVLDDAARLSELAVPILHEGRVIGVIDSEHSRLGFFTEEHQALLVTVASMAGARIARALLEDELRALNRDLERKVEERTVALAEAHRRARTLLLNVLPAGVAERLQAGEERIAERFDDVTVLFADLVGFTELCSSRPPEEVVRLLERMFGAFDRLTEAAGVEKIKTVGDAYMVVAGLPEARPDHAEVMAQVALQMLDEAERMEAELGQRVELRIGMHTGPVVAGILGTRKFAYDLWGDTVNLASRLESYGLPGRIQVEQSTAARLPGFRFTDRGRVELKGLGPRRVLFLEGRK